LENEAVTDVILLNTVLEAVREKSLPIYNRLRALAANEARRFYVFSNEFHRFVPVQR
jgi:exosome complex exonuclease DIS3/RRP44